MIILSLKNFKTIFLFVCFNSLFPICFSQGFPKTKNAIYLELLGNGGFYSINYERNFNPNIYCRIGIGSFQTMDLFDRSNSGRITTFPVLLSFLSGHNKHHFEIGGGLLFGKITDGSGSEPISDIISFLGYRYQSLSKGLLFRIGLTPFVSLNSTNYPDSFLVSAGMSLGYHF